MSPASNDPTALLQTILDGGIRSVNFFNGRLLSGEDLSAEQRANRDARRRLGQAVGEGIAYGLEVSRPANSTQPLVSVKPGLALNRRGQTLALSSPIELSFVQPPPSGAASPSAGFDACQPLQVGGYSTNADGFYLLVLAPADATEGRAPTSGLGNVASSCNTRYLVEAVQFRLVPLDVPAQDVQHRDRQLCRDPNDRNPARNRVAYRCFGLFPPAGVSPLQAFQRNPFGKDLVSTNADLAAARPDLPAYGLLDDLRPNRLTDCDVPLALIHATPAGIQFVDMWSARRRVTAPSPQGHWAPLLNDRRRAEAEAMLLQFQEHLDWAASQAITLVSAKQLAFLPPAGYLKAKAGDASAWQSFLGDHAPPSETEVDDGLLRAIVARALTMDPIPVGEAPLASVDVYRARSQPDFVLFARSERGRVRVSFSDAPGANRSVQVYASGPAGTRLATGKGAQRLIVADVPAGSYSIRSLVDGYQRRRVKKVPVRAGLITDLKIDLEPLSKTRRAIVEEADRFDAPLRRWKIAGVDEATIVRLERAGLGTFGRLASAEPGIVSRALGHSLEYSRSLIDDARAAMGEIRAKRAYYEGMDEQVAAALSKLGLTDDVALANADYAALAAEVGRGLATRLIEQAREIVPEESWRLDQLGLSVGQIDALDQLGIGSKGELQARVTTEGGRAGVISALGADENSLANLRASAAAQMTASSVALASTKALSQLPGVNAVIGGKLAAANLTTLEDIAAASPSDLALATGLSEAAAGGLIAEAAKGSRAGLDVSNLASISNDTAAALKALGVNTVSDLMARSPADIGGAFGGDTGVAAAVIAGAKQGFRTS